MKCTEGWEHESLTVLFVGILNYASYTHTAHDVTHSASSHLAKVSICYRYFFTVIWVVDCGGRTRGDTGGACEVYRQVFLHIYIRTQLHIIQRFGYAFHCTSKVFPLICVILVAYILVKLFSPTTSRRLQSSSLRRPPIGLTSQSREE